MSGTLSVDEFRERIADSRPACSLCGHKAHSLVAHLATKHNMSVGQYKNQFGKNVPIVSPIVTELLRSMDRKAKATDRLEEFLPAFLKDNADELFNELKPKFKGCPAELRHLIPPPNPDFVFDKRVAKAAAYGLLKGKNVYVEGPTGCGKTDGIEQVHSRLELPVKRVNMNGDVTVANFIGAMRADPQKGTYFMYGNLPKAMQLGITLLIDEIDYTPPAIAAVLNPVLEGGKRTLYLPETDETIKAAPGFNVIGTGNTGGKGDTTGVYTGTEILNTALLDRFPIKLTQDYLPLKEEISMLAGRFPGKDPGEIQKFVQAATEIRRSFKTGTLPVTVSTRKLIDLFEMEETLGQEAALGAAVLNWLDDDNRAVVTKILENHGIRLK